MTAIDRMFRPLRGKSYSDTLDWFLVLGNTASLGVPVLAGSSAYAVAEGAVWRSGQSCGTLARVLRSYRGKVARCLLVEMTDSQADSLFFSSGSSTARIRIESGDALIALSSSFSSRD